jgi:hypothetical protein
MPAYRKEHTISNCGSKQSDAYSVSRLSYIHLYKVTAACLYLRRKCEAQISSGEPCAYSVVAAVSVAKRRLGRSQLSSARAFTCSALQHLANSLP